MVTYTWLYWGFKHQQKNYFKEEKLQARVVLNTMADEFLDLHKLAKADFLKNDVTVINETMNTVLV